MELERIGKRIAAMAMELSDLLAEPFDTLTAAEQLAVATQWETFVRSQATVGHRLIAELADAPISELGESSVARALAVSLRISSSEANRRVHEAGDLGPRRTMTGEVLEPVLAHTAAAQARGSLIPMSEVIRQASSAHHYLAVFDKHTEEPLYLGRERRFASKGQRIMLYARDGGRPEGDSTCISGNCPTAPSCSNLEVGDLGGRITHAGHVVRFHPAGRGHS
jgi:Domain of unknown function (DUF222)